MGQAPGVIWCSLWRLTHATLLCLAMRGMSPATRAKFTQVHATRVIAAILLSGVIAFFTLRARQSNHRANAFLRCHVYLLCTALEEQRSSF